MNKELKNGLIVSGIAVIAYLLYKQFEKPNVVSKSFTTFPTPVEIELKPEPKLESVVLNF